MGAHDIRATVKAMLALQNWTLSAVVVEMNRRNPTRKPTTVANISNKLTRGTIKYSEVLEIAEIIGMTINWNEGGVNHV